MVLAIVSTQKCYKNVVVNSVSWVNNSFGIVWGPSAAAVDVWKVQGPGEKGRKELESLLPCGMGKGWGAEGLRGLFVITLAETWV